MILTKIKKKIYYLRAKYFLKKENFLNIFDLSKKNNKTTGVELTDHYILASYIKKNKINSVLELGTGQSTFVLAEALKKYSKKPVLISMESDKKYYNYQKKAFPKNKFKFCKIIYSKRKLFFWSFLRGYGFQRLPKLNYDLVFVDGPNANPTPGFYKNNEPAYFCFDFINLILRSRKSFDLIIDSRMSTSIVAKILFPHKYNYYPYLKLTIIKNVNKMDMTLIQSNISQFKKLANNKNLI